MRDRPSARTGEAPSGRWRKWRSATAAVAGGLAAVLGVGLAWGFTVDDALISTRVAHHLARGLGYRFNPDGAIVDCVTPLGWALLVKPFAWHSPWRALEWARVLGSAVWVASTAWLTRRCAKQQPGVFWLLIPATLALNLPIGAWAASGMETPWIMALGCLALLPGWRGALAAGTAAALRPELMPWALSLTFGSALAAAETLRSRVLYTALAIAPAIAVAATRASVFGHAAPLAIFAKPSDLQHGVQYAMGALLLSGPPYLLATRRGWRSLDRHHVAIAVALGVHWLSVLGAGGDWMPFWRLFTPVVPGLLVLGVALARSSRPWPNAARLGAVWACAAVLHVAHGASSRGVNAQRKRMSAELPALLGNAQRVATLDVGWVGAAGDLDVIDLAGVTDPEVAYRPGGHTSKRLANDFLVRRDVEAMVVLLNSDGAPARNVERHLARLRGADRFTVAGHIALTDNQRYVVLRREDDKHDATKGSE